MRGANVFISGSGDFGTFAEWIPQINFNAGAQYRKTITLGESSAGRRRLVGAMDAEDSRLKPADINSLGSLHHGSDHESLWILHMLRDYYGDSQVQERQPAVLGYDGKALALIDEPETDRGLVELEASWLELDASEFDLCGDLNADALCAKVSSINLDIEKIAEQVRPILEKFVNVDEESDDFENGYLDKICIPLGELNKVIEALETLTGQSWTMLDVAEMFLGDKSGAPTVVSSKGDEVRIV